MEKITKKLKARIKHNGAIKFDDPVVLQSRYIFDNLELLEIRVTRIFLYQDEIWGKVQNFGDLNLESNVPSEDDWLLLESSVDELEITYPPMILTYSTHLSTKHGKEYHITTTPQVGVNRGGLYCEIYEDLNEDPIDDFVLELGDDPDTCVKNYMTMYYG